VNLIFYDLETTGISKHFDQILQFGSLRADEALCEIDRFEIRSRLLPHVVPSPMALHVTGQSIEAVLDPARPSHYEMMSAIRQKLARWCPAIFLGYNSVSFDEEFLRQAFYQNLHPPYLTNTGGSGRADVLTLVRAISILQPDLLSVPRTEKGRPVFNLDRLAPANNFPHLNAHDAMADVEATIHLCRIIRDGAPLVWERFLSFSRKPAVLRFLEEETAFLQFERGGRSPRVVTALGASPSQGNTHYCLDLAAGLDELRGLNDEELATRLRKSPRLVRKVKINAAPMLLPLSETPEFLLGGITEADLLARAGAVREDPELVARLIAASEGGATVYEPAVHVEQQLYEGFWPDADARLLERFHRVEWEDRVAITSALSDPRLRRLARRLVLFERPDLLAEDHRVRLADEMRCRVLGTSEQPGPWLTVPAAIEVIDKLLETVGEDGRERMASYKAHLKCLFSDGGRPCDGIA